MNQKLSTRNLILCAMFSALIAVGAFIKISIFAVPFTLQVFFTTLAGVLLGSKLGAMSVLIYMLLGLAGLPIFTGGGGIWYILKPTFGYIIGFCVGAYVTGLIVEKTKFTIKNVLVANFVGLVIVYAFGLAYFYIIANYVVNQPITMWALVLSGLILAAPGDIFLCIAAAVVSKRLRPVIQ